MKIRNEGSFNAYMKDFSKKPENKELNQKSHVEIFLVALGFKAENAQKWANKGLLAFAPLRTILAQKGQELVKVYNNKEANGILLPKDGKIADIAAKVLNAPQMEGKQVFVPDANIKNLLILKGNEERIGKFLESHDGPISDRLKSIMNRLESESWKTQFNHPSEKTIKDIEFLVVLLRVPEGKGDALLSAYDEAAKFIEETGLPLDYKASPEEWNDKIQERLARVASNVPRALREQVKFNKTHEDIHLFNEILEMHQWLENPNVDKQTLMNLQMDLQKLPIDQLAVFKRDHMYPAKMERAALLNGVQSAGIQEGLVDAVVNEIVKQGYLQDLDKDAINGIAKALKELKGLNINPQEIVSGLKDYLNQCAVKEVKPFAKEQLAGLEARIINPTDLIRVGTEIKGYKKEWIDGLPKGSPLVAPFLEEFGFAVPFPHKTFGWEPGDAQKKIFDQMVDFAKANPNLSPQAIVKAFKREVLAIADRTEPATSNAYYLKENVVGELAKSGKALQRIALYGQMEQMLIDKNVPQDQVPLLVEFLIAKINLGGKPLTPNGRLVLDYIAGLLANPEMTAEEKGHKLNAIKPDALFNLNVIDNVENRNAALKAGFDKPATVSLEKLGSIMTNEPGKVATPVFQVLLGFYRNKLDTREGIDAEQQKFLEEIEKGINESSSIKSMLQQVETSFLPTASPLFTLQSPEFVKMDTATFTAGMKVAVDNFEPPPNPLMIADAREQAVHKVMQNILMNVAKARSEQSGMHFFLTETWPELQGSVAWKTLRKVFTEKRIHLVGRVLSKFAGPLTFIANKFFDKAIKREIALGNHAKANMYGEVQKMFKPLLMLGASLLPGIMQRHSLLCIGENPVNIEGALNVLSAAMLDPGPFNTEKQNKLLNDLKPYLGTLLTELSPYGDMVNNLIASVTLLGTQ